MAASRKLYILLARDIKDALQRNPESEAELEILAGDIAVSLKQDNIHFDRSRFLDACGFTL